MEMKTIPSSFCKGTKHVQPPSSTTVWALSLLEFPRVDGTVEPYGGEKYIIQDRPMKSRLSSWGLPVWTDLSIDHDSFDHRMLRLTSYI